jgi:hypothetical protein
VLTLADPGGRARFDEGGVTGCTTQSATRVECPASAAGSLSLPLYVQDNRTADTAVTITVARADGVEDADAANDSVTVVLERYRPTPVDVAVDASAPLRGNSGKAEVTVVVTSSDPAAPVSLTGTYDPLIAPAPDGCTLTSDGAACTVVGDTTTLVFTVDVDRIRNEPQAGDLRFAVGVPETYEDTNSANNTDQVTVARFDPTDGSKHLATDTTGPATADPTRVLDLSGTVQQLLPDGLTERGTSVHAAHENVRAQVEAHGKKADANGKKATGRAGHDTGQPPGTPAGAEEHGRSPVERVLDAVADLLR